MVDTDKTGGRNPLVEAVKEIDVFAGQPDRDRELDAIRGEKVADRLEDDPRFQRVAADPSRGVEAANGTGSFEALMTLMGGGAKPAMPGLGQGPS